MFDNFACFDSLLAMNVFHTTLTTVFGLFFVVAIHDGGGKISELSTHQIAHDGTIQAGEGFSLEDLAELVGRLEDIIKKTIEKA